MTTVLEEVEQYQQKHDIKYILETLVEEPKQRQTYLTIDDIMPKWSHYLDLLNHANRDYTAIYDWEQEHDLDMGEHAKCAVGEAHLFNDDYHTTSDGHPAHCIGCELYAGSVFPKLYDAVRHKQLVGLNWRDVQSVQNFVQHWNIHHSEVTNKN